MRYLLLICIEAPGSPTALGRDDAPEVTDVEPWVEDLDGRGVRLIGSRTRPASDATTVRVRKGEVLLTDGPFAETKELMVGFDVIECADLDEAIEIASRHPVAHSGMVEVRPFWEE